MNISLSGRRRLGVLTAVRISTANAQVSTNGVHSRMVDKPEVIQKRVLGNFGGNGPKSLGRINPPIAEVGPFLTRFSTQNWILSAELGNKSEARAYAQLATEGHKPDEGNFVFALAAARTGEISLAEKWAAGYDRKSPDRKSTRLNSSHLVISYAVFCLKKKKQ